MNTLVFFNDMNGIVTCSEKLALLLIAVSLFYLFD